MRENCSARTCLDCGFLTIRGYELTQADRVMLRTRGQSAVMPADPEQTGCYRNCWTDYDLTYSGDSLNGVFEELGRPRQKCPGFFQYEPGFTPAQDLERQEERRREQVQWRTAKVGFWGAFLGALIGVVLPSLLHRMVGGWRWIEGLFGRYPLR